MHTRIYVVQKLIFSAIREYRKTKAQRMLTLALIRFPPSNHI